jgi:glycosyltransferase involved in cell wall biosynthesis
MTAALNLVFLGPPLGGSQGPDHAAVFRPLLAALQERGHRIAFLVPGMPPESPRAHAAIAGFERYASAAELADRHGDRIAGADLVAVCSHLPEGARLADWVLRSGHGIRAYYDLDTAGTLGLLASGDFGGLRPAQIAEFDLYLSLTGGPWLDRLRDTYRPVRAVPLHCSVDPTECCPEGTEPEFDLGYLGRYEPGRLPRLQELLLEPARRLDTGFFAVAGAGFPDHFPWPANVLYVERLPASAHGRFFAGQRYTLDLARRDLLRSGWAPTPTLLQAMVTGTPVISDNGQGLAEHFKIGHEILVADNAQDVVNHLTRLPESTRRRIAERARGRVLAAHTAAHRAEELERLLRRAQHDSARHAQARTHRHPEEAPP